METNAPDPGKFGCSALKSSSKSTWLADSRKIPLQKCVVYQYIHYNPGFKRSIPCYKSAPVASIKNQELGGISGTHEIRDLQLNSKNCVMPTPLLLPYPRQKYEAGRC